MEKGKWFTLVNVLACIIPLVIYIILSLELKNWIVDDAGISFAYSKSLANGYGLVPQPGAERVEGFSNFLWVILFTPFLMINQFEPYITSKLISGLFVLLIFIYTTKITALFKISPIYALIANSLIAFNTPFVIWMCSGLENPLYVFLIIVLVYISIKYTFQAKTNLPVISGILVFMISITRPDGIMYACIFPLAILLKNTRLLQKINPMILYVVILGICMGGFLLFRQTYFNAWVPNTYYAKEASTTKIISELFHQKNALNIKYHSIFRSLGGLDFIYIFYFFSLVFITSAVLIREQRKNILLLIGAWLIPFLIYMLLPYDLMGEYRFATAFVVLTILLLSIGAAHLVKLLPRFKKITISLLLLFIAIYSFVQAKDQYKKLMAFKHHPTVPFYTIKTAFMNKFDSYASVLNLKNASVLMPDVGATYFYSELVVYDLGGLCDKTFALARFTNNPTLRYQYTFETLKPTFIHVHDGWADLLRPDGYPHFREEYIPIYEELSADYSNYRGENIYSGDYIRKDVITPTNSNILQAIILHRENLFD